MSSQDVVLRVIGVIRSATAIDIRSIDGSDHTFLPLIQRGHDGMRRDVWAMDGVLGNAKLARNEGCCGGDAQHMIAIKTMACHCRCNHAVVTLVTGNFTGSARRAHTSTRSETDKIKCAVT